MKMDSHTKQHQGRRSEDERGAQKMRDMAGLTRRLSGAATAVEAAELALRGLAQAIPAECMRLTVSVGEDRQQLRARLEGNGEFEYLAEGETLRVAHTMLERAVQMGSPVRFNNAPQELVSRALLISLVCTPAQSILCAPLSLGEKIEGIIVASTRQAAAYTEADTDTAAVIAHLLAMTLKRIELSETATVKRQSEEARAREEALVERLHSVTQASFDLDHIIQQTIDELAQALPASFVLLRPVSFGRPEPTVRAWTPNSDRPPLEVHAPVARIERPVYTEQRPVFVEDLRAERAANSDLDPLAERLGARSIYVAPVVYGGQVLAALGLVEADGQRQWTRAEQSVLMRVAETIAPLILNAQLHGRLRSYIEDLLMLLRLAGETVGEAELDRCLRAVLDSWSKIAGTDAAAILRWDEEAKLLRLAATKHLPTGILERYTQGVPLTDPVCGLAATRRVAVVADLASEPRFASLYTAARWSGLRGVWATPVMGHSNKLLGMLITFSRVVAEVGSDEQRLADLFARPAAFALQNLEWTREVRALAQSNKQLEDDLRQSERHKTEFMSIISHELRTPLNAIIGYAQMLKEGFSGPLNEAQASDVQTISDSADRLLSMVEDTLDLARIDAERFPVYMDTIAFEEIVKRATGSVRAVADKKGLNIQMSISEDLPVVRTDPERVRQVLMNLLSNAVKFTESGAVHVHILPGEGGSVQINVMDTGIGFDTKSFPHLFEEFRQADTSNTRAYGGTGLGLAVSKRLVRRLGGTIGVTSTPGEGSTFWFSLPPEVPDADR
ncbi:MAG TPA: ATP-binding protein [Pyrinomonadaceae bacterium]|jgi:signal transduction histidine kinase/chorismate mutase|nr:ATP-binding protein [Pyrinomonadaceae bacterium]